MNQKFRQFKHFVVKNIKKKRLDIRKKAFRDRITSMGGLSKSLPLISRYKKDQFKF